MDKFDNTKPNVILMADITEPLFMQKSAGISRVASELRLAGYEVVQLNHLHVFEYEELKYLLKQLINNQTLYIGFSNFFYRDLSQETKGPKGEVFWPLVKPGAMVPHGLDYNQDLKKFIKQCNPDCKLVIGGPISGDGEYNKDYDYCLQGYADISSVNLADHLSKGTKLNKSRKSIWGYTVVDDIRADGYDITKAQTVIKEYDSVLDGETMTIEISRGCVFKCAFCSYPFNGKAKNDFIRDEDLIYQEMLENYEKFGVTRYILSDDTFNDSPEKAYMINRISKRLPFELEFWAYTRIDLLAKHLNTVDQLVEAGQRGFFFGIETWNKPTGEVIGKGLAKEKQIKALKYLKDTWGNDIMLHGSFIVGLPHETEQTAQATADILSQDNFPLDSALFFNFTIENTKNFNFNSDIATNPEKYGYTIVEENPISMKWENEHFTYDRCLEFTKELNSQIKNKGEALNGLNSFYIASLGFNLDFSRNVKFNKFPWNKVWDQKQERGRQYKSLIYKNFEIDPYEEPTVENFESPEYLSNPTYDKPVSPGMEIYGKQKD